MRPALLLALAACTARGPTLSDRGPSAVTDAHHHDPDLSHGRMAGLRELWVDPATFPDTVEPVDGRDGTGVLEIHNPATVSVVLAIGDTRVGVIGPRGKAVVSQVPAGRYAIRFHQPSGFVKTVEVDTRP